MVKVAVRKEERTHTAEEDTCGIKEERKEQRNEKENGSLQIVTHVERKDTARGSTQRRDRTEEERKGKAFKGSDTYVGDSDTPRMTVGTQGRAKEATEEHT